MYFTKKRTLYVNINKLTKNNKEKSKPIEGSLDFIKELSINYEIIIFTEKDINKTCDWLEKYGFKSYIKEITNIRKSVFAYIDDHGLNINQSRVAKCITS